jgi:hypothetical protein
MFLSGLELSKLYYEEVVSRLLQDKVPGVPYSAALIGTGSEVLGFDTEMSRDHDWGPRLQILLNSSDSDTHIAKFSEALRCALPATFRGFETKFATTTNAEHRHHVEVLTCRQFFLNYLDYDLDNKLTSLDWLGFPQQRLRGVTAGAIFRDEVGLQAIRNRFSFYPHDVWLYLLSCAWRRIGQEEHLAGRAGQLGDQLGSSLIFSRLARDLMRICFLMERQYAPYPKWFGTAFSKLACASKLSSPLVTAFQAPRWQDREDALVAAYALVIELHNALGITERICPQAKSFFGRPYRVIAGEAIADALLEAITDTEIKKLFGNPFGSIDLVSDNTDFLDSECSRRNFMKLLTER